MSAVQSQSLEGNDKAIELPNEQVGSIEQIKPENQPVFKINCPERQEVANQALDELKRTFEILGIQGCELPTVNIKFSETKDKPPARVEVHGESVEIIFNQQCSTPEGEKAFISKLGEDVEFPGVQQVLKHELAHISMWSVTGMTRQPAVRLLDEGWARLVEDLGSSTTPNLDSLTKKTKTNLVKGLNTENEIYNRCLDLARPVSQLDNKEELESLNNAEYETGKALLIWIREKFGNKKMIEFIAKAPQTSRKNDEKTDSIESAAIDSTLHSTTKEYNDLFSSAAKGEISNEEMIKKGREWESRQFQRALLETTGMNRVREVETDFKKWIKQQ